MWRPEGDMMVHRSEVPATLGKETKKEITAPNCSLVSQHSERGVRGREFLGSQSFSRFHLAKRGLTLSNC